MSNPTCRNCGAVLEPRTSPSRDASWCGTWYDHPSPPRGSYLIDHDASVLEPSVELLELHRQLRDTQTQDEGQPALPGIGSGDPA